MAKALSGAPGRTVREFTDYPAKLSEIPRIVEQGFSVVLVDVDSDESYALKIIEGFAAADAAMVMAYSQRNDPALVASCMRAGAREFLPLPGRQSPAEVESTPAEEIEEPSSAPSQTASPIQSKPDRVSALPTFAPPTVLPETKSGLPPLVWESDAIERETAPVSLPREEAAPRPLPVDSESESPNAEPSPSRPSNFEAWDAANLRVTQTAAAKQIAPPMRTPSPHELFARSRKSEPEQVAQSDSKKDPRQVESAQRLSAAPELLGRGERPKVQEIYRHDSADQAPPREMKASSPLPHEMFLKNGPEGGSGNATADVPMDAFERTPRQVYKPSPQEMTFSSLASDADEGKQKGGGMMWAFLAAGAGMLGCLAFLFFFFSRPANSHPAPVPPANQPAAPVTAPAPAQPDVFDKEFNSSTASAPTTKPSTRSFEDEDSTSASSDTNRVSSQMMDQQLSAQTKLSGSVKQPVAADEPPTGFTPGALDAGAPMPGATFGSRAAKVVPAGAAISGGVAEGLLIHRTPPVYPSIAKSAHVEGTISIGATITKSGALTNLHVVSGPGMLREAAMNAVKSWRYRPYMLNNQPVDVDTTITVVFSLSK